MRLRGEILTCGVDKRVCPCNWSMLVESSSYIEYFRENCPHGQYEQAASGRCLHLTNEEPTRGSWAESCASDGTLGYECTMCGGFVYDKMVCCPYCGTLMND